MKLLSISSPKKKYADFVSFYELHDFIAIGKFIILIINLSF